MFRAAVDEADPVAKVPSCPGWTFTELTLHVARFLETSLEYLRTGSTVRLKPLPEPVDRGARQPSYLDVLARRA
jgi:hypothetical protein